MAKTKLEKFEEIILDLYGAEENYQKILLNLLNIRDTMLIRVATFKSKSAKDQFKYCETIAIITIQTLRQHINQNRPISSYEKMDFPCSADRYRKDFQNQFVEDSKDVNLKESLQLGLRQLLEK